MTLEEALQKLSRLVDPDGSFAIPDAVLEDAIADNTRWATWAAETAYEVGARIVPAIWNGRLYKCSVRGTSGATAPDWPDASSGRVSAWKVEDGDDLVWEDDGPVKNRPYNFEGAAYDVCMAMARRNSAKTDVTDSGVSVKRSQLYAHWMAMAASFSLSSEVA